MKFAIRQRPNLRSPLRTQGGAPLVATHEGAPAWEPDLRTELYLAAATHMAGEDTFYERAAQREARLVDLVHRVVAVDPDWVARFAAHLRADLKIRSASILVAAEYVAAGGQGGRRVVASVLQRADEPAEMLAYWHSRHGRRLPMPVKRGIADGAVRLYTERSALRYDGVARVVRMADVIELTHPKAKAPWQHALFRWLLDRRHHGDATAEPTVLPMLAAHEALAAVSVDERRAVLRERGPAALAEAGVSWERLAGWLPGGMDAEAWESVIPSMGVMALIRNLRNFDQTGIDRSAADVVRDRITDADEVARARLFPYQVWAAYQAAPSDEWKRALGTTLDLTTPNVPALDRSLIVIDTSGSMQAPVANRSTITRVQVAAVMAAVTAARAREVDVVIFGAGHRAVTLRKGASVLGTVAELVGLVGTVGHATYGHTAIAAHWRPRRHDRVVLFTDDQMADAGSVDLGHIPTIHTVDLAGYRPRSLPSGGRGRHTMAGFGDADFGLLQTLEAGHDAVWPF